MAGLSAALAEGVGDLLMGQQGLAPLIAQQPAEHHGDPLVGFVLGGQFEARGTVDVDLCLVLADLDGDQPAEAGGDRAHGLLCSDGLVEDDRHAPEETESREPIELESPAHQSR